MNGCPVLCLSLVLAGAGAAAQEGQRPYEPPSPPGEAARAAAEAQVVLERVTTAVPWPRGIVFAGEKLVVVTRGRHRRAGGLDPVIDDRPGRLYVVDPEVAEPVVPGREVSHAVRENRRVLADPTEPPFRLWDRKTPPLEAVHIDRPYCTLAWDPLSRNLFLCGYSGVDLPGGAFRKNATDSILRFDLRTRRWHVVEAHRPDVVPLEELSRVAPNQYYPHQDPSSNAPPHGWLNGPNGAEVAGRFLYAVGKDNHTLAQYDLAEVRERPDAPPPSSRRVFSGEVDVRAGDGVRRVFPKGPSTLAVHGGHLYVGYRTTSEVLRFPLAEDGDLVRPLVGEKVARFTPWCDERGASADLIDMAFDGEGRLFVSCAARGRVWKVGVPDPEQVFHGVDEGEEATEKRPWVDLRALTGNPTARTSNIAFDARGRLYICSGSYDADPVLAGVVYRATPRAP